MAPLRPLRNLPLLRQTAPQHRLFSTTPRAADVAKMTIVGRLAAEPELQVTSTGQEMIKYAVGTNYGPKENKQASWWRVAGFMSEGPQRELIMGLPKGSLVYVEGEVSMRNFVNSEGKNQSALSIVQKTIEVLKRPEKSSEFPSSSYADHPVDEPDMGIGAAGTGTMVQETLPHEASH